MLSTKAWNALLKTVEEPPPHAKFIFATTEMRKVPVTVLSRCQRFELRRVEPEELATHLAGICAQGGRGGGAGRAGPDRARGRGLGARRALAAGPGDRHREGPVDGELVQTMLGLGDRLQLLELFDAVMQGDAAVRWIASASSTRSAPTRWRWSRTCSRSATGCPGSRWRPRRPRAWASPPQAVGACRRDGQGRCRCRCWRGPGRCCCAASTRSGSRPTRAAAAEMLLLRLACVSDLPSPAELARLLRGGDDAEPAGAPVRSTTPPVPAPGQWRQAAAAAQPVLAPLATSQPIAVPTVVPAARDEPADFAEFVALLRDGGEAPLAAWLTQSAHLIRFEPGRIELRFEAGVPADVAGRVGEAAIRVFGRRWMVIVGSASRCRNAGRAGGGRPSGAHGGNRAGPGAAGGAGGLSGGRPGRHPAARRLGATARSHVATGRRKADEEPGQHAQGSAEAAVADDRDAAEAGRDRDERHGRRRAWSRSRSTARARCARSRSTPRWRSPTRSRSWRI